MTLSEMASFVCTKVNQTETEDVAACTMFLTRRQQMIWNESIWKDSLVEYLVTVGASAYTVTSSWLPTKGVLLLPSIIDRVLAVRTDLRRLNVQRPEYYYRIDYDTFAKTGTASEFILLPPCVWEFDTAQACILAGADVSAGADLGVVSVLDTLSSDGVNVVRQSITQDEDEKSIGTTARIDSWAKPATADEFLLSAGASSSAIILMSASQTGASRLQRIRLQLTPPTGTGITLRVLGKRAMPTFTADGDLPAINGSENLLLALAQADMLQRERQYGKAEAVMQGEALPLLDQLKRIETVQQAHRVRLIPDQGYAPEYEFASGGYNPLTF